jgi:hypothetical protein
VRFLSRVRRIFFFAFLSGFWFVQSKANGGGLIFNRAPALPRHSACVFRVPRPKPRLPASCVAVPAPHPWRTEGEGLDEVARRALLAFVSAPQVLLDSGVGFCLLGGLYAAVRAQRTAPFLETCVLSGHFLSEVPGKPVGKRTGSRGAGGGAVQQQQQPKPLPAAPPAPLPVQQ